MALTEQNNISIAEICIYTPALFIGIWLAIRHGFGRNAGWLYLIIFSITRILGASLQLATINQPTNISLYMGAATLANIGLSPIILVQYGLLGRALGSIRRTTKTFLDDRQLRLCQLVVIAGLILGAIGGSQAGSDYGNTGEYHVTTLSKAGIVLMLVGYVLLVLATLTVLVQISFVEQREKRLLIAVALSLPFILVRLLYAALDTFSNDADFNPLNGKIDIQLGMAIIMEMIVIAIVEAVGLTLQKLPPGPPQGQHVDAASTAVDGGETEMGDWQKTGGPSQV